MGVELLIVDDAGTELVHGIAAADKAGFSEVKIIDNVQEALDYVRLQQPRAVLTDLFMPGSHAYSPIQFSVATMGAENALLGNVLPLYANFKNDRIKDLPYLPVMRLIAHSAEVFEMSPEDYFTHVISHPGTPKQVIDASRVAVKELNRWNSYDAMVNLVGKRAMIPAGIMIMDAAREQGIPAAIVTSTNHQDYAFAAIRSLIPLPYADTMVDDHKNWGAGIRLIR